MMITEQAEPAYEHDHNGCIFLGQDNSHPGEPKCNIVDLYICTQAIKRPEWYCLIRRYSSKPGDYGSWAVEYVKDSTSRYARNVELAKQRGII